MPHGGHHARHHVIEVMAVKRPFAVIARVAREGDAAHCRNEDRIAYRTQNASFVKIDTLEMVTVQLHGMGHHGEVVPW